MTEFVLALIPDYGLYVVFAVVLLACCGMPLPSSIVVLTAGALAAAGDLVFWHVIAVAIIAYWIGDQLAFNSARWLGPRLLTRLRKFHRIAPLIARSEALLDKHGLLAVFLSRTIFSPTGPYVSYVTGAVRMDWLTFSAVAMPSATLWGMAYALLGFGFAGELPQVSKLVASMLIVGVATLAAIGFAVWIAILWRRFDASPGTDQAV